MDKIWVVYGLDGSRTLVLIHQFWWLYCGYVGNVMVYKNDVLKYLEVWEHHLGNLFLVVLLKKKGLKKY